MAAIRVDLPCHGCFENIACLHVLAGRVRGAVSVFIVLTVEGAAVCGQFEIKAAAGRPKDRIVVPILLALLDERSPGD